MKIKLLLSGLLTFMLGCASVLLQTNASFAPVSFNLPEIKSSADFEFSLISTGDIGLVRDINYKIKLEQKPNYPFLKIANYLKSADLTIANLEGPLINNCPISREGFTFCGEDENVSGLVFAGIDGVNLANNHSTNYGLEGLGETVQVLMQAPPHEEQAQREKNHTEFMKRIREGSVVNRYGRLVDRTTGMPA